MTTTIQISEEAKLDKVTTAPDNNLFVDVAVDNKDFLLISICEGFADKQRSIYITKEQAGRLSYILWHFKYYGVLPDPNDMEIL